MNKRYKLHLFTQIFLFSLTCVASFAQADSGKTSTQPEAIHLAKPMRVKTESLEPAPLPRRADQMPTGAGGGQYLLRNGEMVLDNQKKGDAQKVEYGPYLQDLKRRIYRAWFPPKKIQAKNDVVVELTIANDGLLKNTIITGSSGKPLIDQSALKAIENASPFRPLPPGSPPEISFEFKFKYTKNEGFLDLDFGPAKSQTKKRAPKDSDK